MIKVLLVEDNAKISENISLYLKDSFEIQAVFSGEDAMLYLEASSYDLVILDLMLPGISGMEVLKYIEKKRLHIGVLILTAKEDLGDKLMAFENGAQDYLTKPFFMEELKARLYVILKNMGKVAAKHILSFKDLQYDLDKREVTINGEELELNERLYMLLEYFMVNQGILLFKEQIFERICGYDSDASTEIVEVYMSHLRKKLAYKELAFLSEIHLEEELDVQDIYVNWDVLKVKRCLTILLENAIKYTPAKGYIYLRIFNQDKTIKCVIEDTGYGIKSEELPYIFDRFYRSNEMRGKQIDGSGIGLSILQAYASSMGIKVEVYSSYGTGSCFILEIPNRM